MSSYVCILQNENRPTAWEQVSDCIDKQGFISNKEVRKILGTDDVLRASKYLKEWVGRGLIEVVNPHQGTKVRAYAKPGILQESFLFSKLSGKQTGNNL